MAPEAFVPPFGAEVDVWSMGCLIVEMSTGSPPWADFNMQQIMMAVAMLKRVPDVHDTVPAAEAVRQCFAFDPKERPTASALADAFRLPADDVVGANPAELQRQQLQIDALRRENAALAAENAAQLAELAAHTQAAEAAASRLRESEALVAQLTGEIAAQRAAHAAQIAEMEALLAQRQRELGRRYVRQGDTSQRAWYRIQGGRCRLGSCVICWPACCSVTCRWLPHHCCRLGFPARAAMHAQLDISLCIYRHASTSTRRTGCCKGHGLLRLLPMPLPLELPLFAGSYHGGCGHNAG
jgi:hypothetical protein